MGERVLQMFESVRKAFADVTELAELSRTDDQVNVLYGGVLDYLGEIRQHALTQRESNEFVQLMSATHDLRAMSDVVAGSLGDLARGVSSRQAANQRDDERCAEHAGKRGQHIDRARTRVGDHAK